MNRKKIIRLIGASVIAMIALFQPGCTKVDSIPRVDFTIDISDPQYYPLLNTGGYIFINGLIVFKGLDGYYYALSHYCSYDGCNVEYQVSYDRLYCPCDGSLFDIDGSVMMGPATVPLYQYATSMVGTLLHVYTP